MRISQQLIEQSGVRQSRKIDAKMDEFQKNTYKQMLSFVIPSILEYSDLLCIKELQKLERN